MERRAGLARRLRAAAAVAASAAACAAGARQWPAAVAAVRGHPYFAVSEIAVRGNRALRREAVLEAAGLRTGMSIWDVDPRQARENIEALARVRRASVRREFPRRVVITVLERQPAAIAVLHGMQYVDGAGRLLGEVRENDPLDYPFVTGVEGHHLHGAGKAVLRRAVRLARLCEERGSAGGPSEIHIDPARGLILVPRHLPVPVTMGWGNWRRKLERLDRILALWEGRESELAALDLTPRRAAVVQTRRGAPPAWTRGREPGMEI